MVIWRKNGDVTHHQGIPFSVLLVDESTFLIEKAIRDLLPWLAVTNPLAPSHTTRDQPWRDRLGLAHPSSTQGPLPSPQS
ncbi:MAG TPA: hypothetical protein VM912_03235 [Terriglobales bacterium]|nr:hypothetical protein [Terriglobales bacterium]